MRARPGPHHQQVPGGTQLALGVDHMSFADGSAKTSLHRRGWVLGARHQTGAHVVYGGFGKAGNVACSLANGAACNGEETGARQFAIACNYVASKELLQEVHLSQVANQTRAKYDFDSGGLSPGVCAKLTSIGAGGCVTRFDPRRPCEATTQVGASLVGSSEVDQAPVQPAQEVAGRL